MAARAADSIPAMALFPTELKLKLTTSLSLF
jgi:hypothetical protein